jgi:hypothetical protein
MKSAIEFGWKMVGGISVLAAVGAAASAQRSAVGQGLLPGGSLGADLVSHGPRRAPTPTWGGERSAEAPTRRPRCGVGIRPDVVSDPVAVIPLLSDLGKFIQLSGGRPGDAGMIEVGLLQSLQAESGDFHAVLRHVGVFEQDGTMTLDLPSTLSLSGLAARGVALSSRFVTVAVELEPAAEEVYAEWLDSVGIADPLHGTRGGNGHPVKQLGTGAGRAAQATLSGRFVTVEVVLSAEETEASIGDVQGIADPAHGTTAGHGSAFPKLKKAGGRASKAGAPGKFVEVEVTLEDSNEVATGIGGVGQLPDPTLGTRAGNGTQMPARLRGGHIRR